MSDSIAVIGRVARERLIAGFPLLNFERPNKKFDPPTDEIWARLHVILGEQNQVTTGETAKRYRRQGQVVIQLFTQFNTGTGEIDEKADEVEDVFRSKSVDGVRFLAPRSLVVGRDADLWQVNVVCPFFYDFNFAQT